MSLDEGDNDTVRLWSYLIGACQTVLDGVGEAALALCRAPQPLPVEAVLVTLINDLAKLDRDLVLVLDDYHTIQNENIHAAISFLLEHLPGNLHIGASTRVDPPWPLARYRARHQLIEIRAVDLRFTTEDASVFLNQVMGVDASAEHVAALSMKGSSDIAEFIKAFTGSHVYVAEYLLEEVLMQKPEEMQTFLLQTSILERLMHSGCKQR